MVVGTPGNDRLSSSNGETVHGDAALNLYGVSPGNGLGNDTITTKGYLVYGDAEGLYALYDNSNVFIQGSIGGNDTIKIASGAGATNAYGDASYLSESTGGNDTITNSSSEAGQQLVGDASVMPFGSNPQAGGNDRLSNAGGQAELIGDASVMYSGDGGNDTLQAGRNGDSLYGDAFFFMPYTPVVGDADQITGGAGPDQIAGDALEIFGQEFDVSFVDSYGGNDLIDGRGGGDLIWGDAQSMDGGFAGDDAINGGTGNDKVWGDFQIGQNSPGGGNDTVNGGTGDDQLWGGPDDDTFVFDRRSGTDQIGDFNSGSGAYDTAEHDLINLRAYSFTWDELASKFTQNGDDVSVIQLTNSTGITIQHSGGIPLEQGDFVL
jgi:Ca2+-binding RTX toxin-like protein